MYKIVSKLLMYGDMLKDSILMQLSDIFKQMDQDTQSRDELVTRIFTLGETSASGGHRLWFR